MVFSLIFMYMFFKVAGTIIDQICPAMYYSATVIH